MKKILLMGNPNTGKTTLFNSLTKSSEHTGNWHGVTVDVKHKNFKINKNTFTLVDLPGLYSLSPNSFEEEVSVAYCLKNSNCLIINICDSNNLKRNLYLTCELMELGLNVILAVNNMQKKCAKINAEKLEKKLGINVVEICAENQKSLNKLKEKIINYTPKQNNFKLNLPGELNSIKTTLNPLQINKIKHFNFFLKKAVFGDEYYLNILKNNKINLSNYINENLLEFDIKNKYNFIQDCLNDIYFIKPKVVGKSMLDKVVLNKFLALPIFVFVITLVFYLTFFSVGNFLSAQLRYVIQDIVGTNVVNFISQHVSVAWVIDLFKNGIFGGIGALLSFLPQVVLLFLFLSVLEDSGYISRLAFCFDDILKKVGLSGKSVYTLIMGFGCSTTACMTARNMSDKNSKIKTAMLAPFMSCSAKLPIYAVICGAFFAKSNVFVVVCLYLLGIVVALCLSMFFEKTYLKSKQQSFIMEFPSYRIPKLKRIANVIKDNIVMFVVRVGSLLFALNIIIWVLQSFSFNFSFVAFQGGKSILQTLGEIICFVFYPLGFSSWGAASALIAGLVAKEVIVSSIAMFNHVSPGANDYKNQVSASLLTPASAAHFTPQGAMSFMVFCLLYCPCISTISVLFKEIGKKWTFTLILIQFLVAYAMAMVVFLVFNLISLFGIFAVCLYAFVIFVFLFSFFYLKKSFKSNRFCSNCKNCKWHCKIK